MHKKKRTGTYKPKFLNDKIRVSPQQQQQSALHQSTSTLRSVHCRRTHSNSLAFPVTTQNKELAQTLSPSLSAHQTKNSLKLHDLPRHYVNKHYMWTINSMLPNGQKVLLKLDLMLLLITGYYLYKVCNENIRNTLCSSEVSPSTLLRLFILISSVWKKRPVKQ